MTTETVTRPAPVATPSTTSGGGTKELLRHIVRLDSEGKPTDVCLCGHVWDRVFIEHGEEICQKCVDIVRRMGGKL